MCAAGCVRSASASDCRQAPRACAPRSCANRLGVVGVISPWNFPLTLTFGPLAGVLAAGNRCMIKPSELTPAVSSLLQRLVGEYFDARELAVVTGGTDVAEAFSRLPFEHLLFTGSTAVGRRVMAAAAANLVPVTLELGGKCPALIGRSADLKRAVDRIMLGKLANAGQMCIAPDYVCVPRELLDGFVQLAGEWVERVYPGLPTNPDYTSMVSSPPRRAHARAHRRRRCQRRARGRLGAAERSRRCARASDCAGADTRCHAADAGHAGGDLRPAAAGTRSYERIDDSVADINARPRPLALYYFGSDRAEMQRVLALTHSGGATVNDIAVHFMAQELPFGGLGASGMGAYHGESGFERFSHARAVFYQTRLDVAGLVGLRPPYGARALKILKLFIRR